MRCMKLSKKRITTFQKHIFDWWKTNKRDLPWRRTHDPYKIFVSEVMLQQTQVSRVLAGYCEFIEQYPTITDLSHASTADVLKRWKGMGYNRRALYLKRAAESIIRDYGGIFPKSEKELVKLPGLGTYTARAILVFAYRQNVAMVDTNIRQIIIHFFFHDKLQKESVIQSLADQLVPRGKSWEWHQALMDFGAIALRKSNHLERSRKNSQPFRETNRFYRGRIMDLLRDKRYREKTLVLKLTEDYGKPKEFFSIILSGLIKDLLIERTGSFISLPR